jgi:hypothetical protein
MENNEIKWTVIGAGPAGIAAVGQLIDAGIPPKKIAWIDPVFKVGDFGTSWGLVVSNTPIDGFIKFYNAFASFEFEKSPPSFMIKKLKPDMRCPLMVAAEPLKWITAQLHSKVNPILGTVLTLRQTAEAWQVCLADGLCIKTQKVILALGAEAMTLPYPNLTTIPFKTTMRSELLNQVVFPEDVIAVFGAYQSARSVQENLAKTNAKKIIHFYRSERSFENHVASLNLSDRVETYPITPTNLLTHIPRCNKAIYAIGFMRRSINIEGLPDDFTYDTQTGVIASGIYGLGIAFPEVIPYTNGRLAYKVSAIWPFIKYLKKTFPIWLKDPTSNDVDDVESFSKKHIENVTMP